MRIRCVKEDMLNAVQSAQRVVSSRVVMPVLTGISLRSEGDRLEIRATDLELSLHTAFDCKTEEEGAAVVNAKLLGEILRNLSSETLSMEKTGNDLMIKDERSSFLLRTMPSEDFPVLPEVNEAALQGLPGGVLSTALNQVKSAVSKDERRMILTGVLFDIQKERINLVGTDSYRLAMSTIELEAAAPVEREMIVPGRAIQELVRWQDNERPVDVFTSEGQIRFLQGEKSLTARLIEGRFPNYGDFIPKETTVKAVFNRGELENAVKRMSLVAPTILMKVAGDQAELESNAAEIGEARENIRVEAEGSIEIAFNAEYLKDGIDAIGGEKAELAMVDAEKPALIRAVEQDAYRYVLMPVRIKRQ